MKKIIYPAAAIAFMFAMVACVSRNNVIKHNEEHNKYADKVHNSRNSVDWDGTYTGVIPCADCEGIKVELTLSPQETYKISYTYLGKSDNSFKGAGKFSWDKDGSSVTLDTKDLAFPPYYKVGENKLIQLDMNGQKITGKLSDKYVLIKNN
ncbi:MAG: copper resistance protein NlpE [Elusimicrobiota bacterium]|jgi:uncharacterized lipoprotein NlpE involved in copper resistance|nr:copper resistance protein NlpE [Elusimicrobiota bacterium]